MNYITNFNQSLSIENQVKVLADKLGVPTKNKQISLLLEEVFSELHKKSSLCTKEDYTLLKLGIHIRNVLERPRRHAMGLVPLAFEMRAMLEYVNINSDLNSSSVKKAALYMAHMKCPQCNPLKNKRCTYYPTFEKWANDLATAAFIHVVLGASLSVIDKWMWWTEWLNFTNI